MNKIKTHLSDNRELYVFGAIAAAGVFVIARSSKQNTERYIRHLEVLDSTARSTAAHYNMAMHAVAKSAKNSSSPSA